MVDLEAYCGWGVEGNGYRKVEPVRICQDIIRASGRRLPMVWIWL